MKLVPETTIYVKPPLEDGALGRALATWNGDQREDGLVIREHTRWTAARDLADQLGGSAYRFSASLGQHGFALLDNRGTLAWSSSKLALHELAGRYPLGWRRP